MVFSAHKLFFIARYYTDGNDNNLLREDKSIVYNNAIQYLDIIMHTIVIIEWLIYTSR